MAENSTQKQRGRPFKKGQSGNPAGKPLGARHKASQLAQALMDGQAEGIVQVVVNKALDGDIAACKLVLERLCPPKKDAPVNLDLPPLAEAGDLPKVSAAILEAMGRGEITPSEAAALSGVAENHRKALEVASLAERVADLEKQQSKVRRRS